MSELIIREAKTPGEIEAIRRIFRDHFARVGLDPTFGGIEEEIADLPGIYAPPLGALLVGVDAAGAVLAAGAMRPLPGPADCGLTAVVVLDAARGRGVGRRLTRMLIDRARMAGHRHMHLDTDANPAALSLWQEAGFVPSPPYFPNPRPGSQHMALDLVAVG